MPRPSRAEAELRTGADLARLDGRFAMAWGTYRAVARPVKGSTLAAAARERAVLQLDDGTTLWLERLDSPASTRPAAERRHLDGRRVRATGTVRAVMPSAGEGLLAPCLDDVRIEPATAG